MTLTPNLMLAMARHQSGEREAALALFKRSETILNELLWSGVLGDINWGISWEPIAMAVALRHEAEAVLGLPISPRVDIESLKPQRTEWRHMKELVDAGVLHARKRQFPQAIAKFQQATNSPAFKWREAYLAFDFPLPLFASYWAMGDEANSIAILRRMHEGMGEKETTVLYQLAGVPWDLPPDLEVRRKESPARLELEQKWKTDKGSVGGIEAETLGLCWLREGGRLEECLEVLQQPMGTTWFRDQTVARAVAAPALWKLERKDEAREMLQRADERYYETVIKPGQGVGTRGAWLSIMMEQLIRQADELIDPGVANAPHVAALPPEGWN